MSVLDASLLAIDAGTVEDRIPDGDVLVYVEEGRLLGALVLDGSHVDAVAVRRSRRRQGIGGALVAAAFDRCAGPLTADFRAELRSFYEGLGFEVEGDGRRLRGTLTVRPQPE